MNGITMWRHDPPIYPRDFLLNHTKSLRRPWGDRKGAKTTFPPFHRERCREGNRGAVASIPFTFCDEGQAGMRILRRSIATEYEMTATLIP
jgi:hypothetical protein